MSREILFRGKRTDNGEWVEGLLTLMFGQYHIIKPSNENIAYPIDPSTVCQFTGLSDKNGRKIWENDIAKFENAFSEKPHIGKVRYYSGAKPVSDNGYYVVDLAECNVWDLEVIGNIFDNPELLEVAHE